MSSAHTILIGITLLSLAVSSLSADVIFFRNGQRVEGKIVGMTRARLTLRTAEGKRVIARTQVRRIVYGAFDPEAEKKKKAEAERKRKEALKKRQEEFKKQQEAREKQEEATRAAEREAERERERQRAEQVRANEDSRDFAGLWRSAIFPGWGQIADQNRAAGYVYGGLFLLGLAGAGASETGATSLDAQYAGRERLLNLIVFSDNTLHGGTLDILLTQQLLDNARAANQMRNIRTGFGVFAGTIYLASIADVLIARPAGPGSALRLNPTPGGLALSLEVKF